MLVVGGLVVGGLVVGGSCSGVGRAVGEETLDVGDSAAYLLAEGTSRTVAATKETAALRSNGICKTVSIPPPMRRNPGKPPSGRNVPAKPTATIAKPNISRGPDASTGRFDFTASTVGIVAGPPFVRTCCWLGVSRAIARARSSGGIAFKLRSVDAPFGCRGVKRLTAKSAFHGLILNLFSTEWARLHATTPRAQWVWTIDDSPQSRIFTERARTPRSGLISCRVE